MIWIVPIWVCASDTVGLGGENVWFVTGDEKQEVKGKGWKCQLWSRKWKVRKGEMDLVVENSWFEVGGEKWGNSAQILGLEKIRFWFGGAKEVLLWKVDGFGAWKCKFLGLQIKSGRRERVGKEDPLGMHFERNGLGFQCQSGNFGSMGHSTS